MDLHATFYRQDHSYKQYDSPNFVFSQSVVAYLKHSDLDALDYQFLVFVVQVLVVRKKFENDRLAS